jgi:hypothetical protein
LNGRQQQVGTPQVDTRIALGNEGHCTAATTLLQLGGDLNVTT